MIKSGKGVIRRRHAKNYIDSQSDRRLQECVRPYQQQGLNALGVDYFEVQLYQHILSTVVCTCKQTELPITHNQELPPNVVNPNSSTDDIIRIDYMRPLFGTRSESLTNLDEESALEISLDDDEIIDDDGEPIKTSENLFSANPNCGICYRTGYIPGYVLYGFDRKVLTTHSLSNTYGYHINKSTAPHTFNKQDEREGFVEFELTIPKYFKRVKYSVRNNMDILFDEELYNSNGQPLTVQDLRFYAGRKFIIRVLAMDFTHAVLEFDLGVSTTHANIAMMSKNLDWSMIDTLGNMNVILPMTIQEVQAQDFIYVPTRNQVLKVTDTPFLRTARDKTLDWSCNTRICQPQEPAKRIHVGKYLP